MYSVKENKRFNEPYNDLKNIIVRVYTKGTENEVNNSFHENLIKN